MSKLPAREAEKARDLGLATSDKAADAASDVVEPEDSLPEISFEQLPESLQQAAGRAGWSSLMPVQSRALPYMLAKRDLMVQSRTGSGKTGAFLLPILDRFDPEHKACQALILVPTRELARQVLKEAERLAGPGGMRPVAVYGGVAYGPQIEAFERGAPLVVGTPGRVLDHLLKRTLTLEGLRILVLDEADRMLSMGFYPDMQRLKEYMPKRAVSGYMFSATFPATVKSLAMEFLTQPDFLSLSRDRVHVAGTVHGFYDVPAMEKDRILMRIIEMENPSSAIIFCNTKVNVRYVSVVLKRFGYDAGELSSALNQNAREKVLDRVRSRKLRFLVATDVAARGIDILELSHVIQYEPPKDSEDYIHRVGRTSRAGAIGEALTLVSGLEKIQLQSIARTFGIDLQERPAPTEEDVEAIVAQRATTLLEACLRDRSAAQVERMQRFVPLARSLAEDDDEVAVMAMLLDDTYQESLHTRPRPAGSAARSQQPAPGKEEPEEADEAVARRLTSLLEARLRDRGSLQTERMQRFVPLARSLGDNDDEVAVMAMLLEDAYQESLTAPRGRAPVEHDPGADDLPVRPKRPRNRNRGRRR